MSDDNLGVVMKDEWWDPNCFRQIEPYENGFVFGFIIGRRELESDGTFDDVPIQGLKDHHDPSSMFVGWPVRLNRPRGCPPLVDFAHHKFCDEIS